MARFIAQRRIARPRARFTRILKAIRAICDKLACTLARRVRTYVCTRPGRSFQRKSFLPPRVNRRTQDGNYGTPLHAARRVDRYFHVGEKYVTNPTLTSSGFRSRSLVQRYISYIVRHVGPPSRTPLSNLIPHSSVRPRS